MILFVLIGWLGILLMVLQYAPQLIGFLKSLVDDIHDRNAEKGKVDFAGVADLALQVVVSLASRTGMSDDWKRQEAWKEVQYGASLAGVTLSESDARTLAELANKRRKRIAKEK